MENANVVLGLVVLCSANVATRAVLPQNEVETLTGSGWIWNNKLKKDTFLSETTII